MEEQEYLVHLMLMAFPKEIGRYMAAMVVKNEEARLRRIASCFGRNISFNQIRPISFDVSTTPP
jgi:hypothetical protein